MLVAIIVLSTSKSSIYDIIIDLPQSSFHLILEVMHWFAPLFLRNWFIKIAPVFHPIINETNKNGGPHAHFHALHNSNVMTRLPRVLIGSLDCASLLLARMITLVLV